MNIETTEAHGLRVTGLEELSASNAAQVRDEVRLALKPECRSVEIDLSRVEFIDSSGLGALIALHKTVRAQQGVLRLLRPAPGVVQLLELTRLHRLFEVVAT